MKFLPDVVIYKEARNEKYLLRYLACSVNYRQKSRKSRFLKMPILDLLSSKGSAGVSIVTSEIYPDNFRLISQRLTILQKNL